MIRRSWPGMTKRKSCQFQVQRWRGVELQVDVERGKKVLTEEDELGLEGLLRRSSSSRAGVGSAVGSWSGHVAESVVRQRDARGFNPLSLIG